MTKLKELFVPYQQSLDMKELGFDEPCIAFFNTKCDESLCFVDLFGLVTEHTLEDFHINSDESKTSAPTVSQAVKFFREKYELRSSIMDFIDDETGIEWDYEIAIIGTDLDENGNYIPLVDYSTDDETRKFKTYEEVVLECLKKLIEIVKNK